MSVDTLLFRLQELNVQVSLDGSELVVNAPDGALTPELLDELRAAKSDIIENLERTAQFRALKPPPTMSRSDDRSRFPLSFSQQRLWYLDQLEPGQPTYNLPFAYNIHGEVSLTKLQTCLDQIIERHEVLRTTFSSERGVPFQNVHEKQAFDLQELSLPIAATVEESIDKALVDFSMQAFDLQDGPLIRAALLPVSEQQYAFLVVAHHAVFDGASVGIFEAEMRAALESSSDSEQQLREPIALQFGDFSRWQESWLDDQVVREYLKYWLTKLGPDLTTTELPLDFPRPVDQTFNGSRVSSLITVADVEKLQSIAGELRATTFVVLMAAFEATLHIMCRTSDVIVGYPIAARLSKDVENLIGFFANTLPLRTEIRKEMPFSALVSEIRSSVVGSMDWSDLPFEKLVEGINPPRDLARSPIFQIFLSYIDSDDFEFSAGDLRFERRRVPMPVSRFDASMFITESSDGMNLVLEYNTDLFEESSARRILDLFVSIISQVLANPNALLNEFCSVPSSDRELMLENWNSTDSASELSPVFDLIRGSVSDTDRTAIEFDGDHLSYGDLELQSNRLANHLLSNGVLAGDLVGIHMERSAEMLVGMLGVMKAGAAYLPLDPGFPSDRLEYMLSDSATSVLLTQSSLAGSLSGFSGQSIALDGEAALIAACSSDAPKLELAGDALAYVLYTSGSTGRPKGVMVPHSCVSNFLQSMAVTPGLNADDVLVAVTTTSFDISVLELFLPLTVGATVVIASGEDAADSSRLKGLLERCRATVMQATPTTWRMLLDAGWQGDAAFRAYCGGEPMPQDLARDLVPLCGELWNLYGPTETTIWSSCAQITDVVTPISIGQPIANTKMYVLDDAQNLQPVGVPGELCIGGAGVTLGYLNQADLTASVFVDDPFSEEEGARLYRTGDLARWRSDGTLQHLGRIDGQVKIRGFRIELGEIETVLLEHPSVVSAACNVWQAAANDQRLVAYIVTTDGQPIATTELRKHLRGKVPDYMVPQHFEKIAAIPLTANGKIDRKALPGVKTAVRAETYESPKTQTEKQIAAIWQEIIGVDRIGRHDFFFEIGGHSLLAVRAAAEMEKQLGRRPMLRDIILEDLAQISAGYESDGQSPEKVEKRTGFVARLLGRSQ